LSSAENIEETVTTPAETSAEAESAVETEAPAAEVTETAEATTETAETTETTEAPATKPARVIPAGKPVQTVGRRKQAIVRVG